MCQSAFLPSLANSLAHVISTSSGQVCADVRLTPHSIQASSPPSPCLCSLPVACVPPQMPHSRELLPGLLKQRFDPLIVHHLGAVNLRLEHESFGVYEQMSLTTFDLLASVVTTFFSAHSSSLDRLTVYYAGTGLRVSLQSHPQAFPDSSVDPFPSTIDTPFSEVVVGGGPSRKVMRE